AGRVATVDREMIVINEPDTGQDNDPDSVPEPKTKPRKKPAKTKKAPETDEDAANEPPDGPVIEGESQLIEDEQVDVSDGEPDGDYF
ncbi:MAG: hypothetical protein GY832_12180, partial [Chloroflexi bacterium]|nr:hypothetical protein [Chloroflexota bacterium]